MVPAAEMRTAGQAIAVIRPRVEIKSGTNIVKRKKVSIKLLFITVVYVYWRIL